MLANDPDRPAAEFNPYAPPGAALGEAVAVHPGCLAEAEAVRRR